MVDKSFIEKVKSALNIVNVVESFTHLHKAGVNYKGVCPFHDDHTPSMVVSPSRQTYHCLFVERAVMSSRSSNIILT